MEITNQPVLENAKQMHENSLQKIREKVQKDYPNWANAPLDKLIPTLQNKINTYNLYMLSSGTLARMRGSYNAYYKAAETNGNLLKGGVNGEFRIININHFRNLISNVVSQVTQSKPAWQPRAINSDTKTQRQTLVANDLCDYYMYQKGFDKILKKATEVAVVCGHADVSLEWDFSLGKEVGADTKTGEVINEGDIISEVFDPTNSIFDPCYSDIKNCPWRILRRFVSKQDLIAKYPEHAATINNTKIGSEVTQYILDNMIWTKMSISNFDVIPVYYFYYRKTADMPEGRFVLFCGGKALVDSALPYEDIPIFRISAGDHINNAFGWSTAYDLLPLQYSYDKSCSQILTNLALFGISIIAAPRGSSVNIIPNLGGLSLIEYNEGSSPPQGINLSQTNGEIFKWIEKLEGDMRILMGVNSVTVGDPATSLKSGAALALIASQSLVFNSPLAHNYTDLLENVGTGLISIFKEYAKTPRLLELTGISNKSNLKEFSSKDIAGVFRVQVDEASALSKTIAGRIQIASELLQFGQIAPDDYIMVLQTGNLSQVLEKFNKKSLSIRAENEELSNGVPVRVLITDDHDAHIREHRCVLDDPSSRRADEESKKIQEAVMAHILEHEQLKNQLIAGNPQLAQVLGQSLPQGVPPTPAPVQNPPVPKGEGVNQPNLPNVPKGAPEQNKLALEKQKQNLPLQ